MRFHTASRIAIAAMAGLAIACAGNAPLDVTEPDLEELSAAVAAGKGKGKGNGGGGGSVFTMDVSAPIMSSAPLVTGAIPNDSSRIVMNFNHDGPNADKSLDTSYFANAAVVDNGPSCFSLGRSRKGAFAIDASSGQASVRWAFVALNDQGDTDVVYVVNMTGTVAGVWLPANVGDTATVTLIAWQLGPSKKKDERNGACQGSGSFTQAPTVLVTRTQ